MSSFRDSISLIRSLPVCVPVYVTCSTLCVSFPLSTVSIAGIEEAKVENCFNTAKEAASRQGNAASTFLFITAIHARIGVRRGAPCRHPS